ncbi:MAG TPA: two-component regulator propeller domain-containing protein, partial [Chryseolinea sp.]|nr:two-component regulator propeller domain-containing protein [Chryseolinea sp.]
MRRLYFLIFLLSLFSPLKAQDLFYSTRNYSAINGLPQSQIKGMVEDRNGYLWVGTQGGGLARFDGRDFKVYTTLDGLLENQVWDIQLDRNNNLWILHTRGVTKFDGLTFKKFQSPKTARPSVTQMWGMFEIADTVFTLSANNRITKIYGDSIYYWEKPYDKEIKRLHCGPKGEVCLLFTDGSFRILTADTTVSIKPSIDLQHAFNFFNYKGDIVFRTKEGVFKLDIDSQSVSKIPWITDDFVMRYDEKNDVLWTANSNGLFRKKLNSHAQQDTIIRDVETDHILIDSEGNTWIGTNGNGLYKYFVQDFKRYNSDNIRSVMAILKDSEGTLWIGTMYKGLWKIKNGNVSSQIMEPGDSYKNMINCIKESPTGEIWIGTGDGLAIYDKKSNAFKWFSRKDGLPGAFVGSIEFVDKGAWIGTGNGLSFYDGSTFKNHISGDATHRKRISTIRFSKRDDILYVATEFGLQTLKDKKIGQIDLPELMNTSALSIHEYKDSLLIIGTSGSGVIVLNPSTHQHKLLSTHDGLASDFIYFVAADDKDLLWIGTEKGINRVRLDNEWSVKENLHYNYDNGLAGVETNQNAYFITPTEKYFGLVDGLYEFNDKIEHDTKSFDVHLTDVQILYGEYSARQYADSTFGFFQIPHPLQLPPDKNHLTFSFNRVDKRYSRSVKYKYFLENFDTKWSRPASVNSVTYSNLPPGDYIFHVMGTNNEGSWTKATVTYPFTIKAPFYKTTSFIIGMFILVGGLVTLVLYLRVQQRIN